MTNRLFNVDGADDVISGRLRLLLIVRWQSDLHRHQLVIHIA